ncbi:MAG: dethiobiotin synthase [Terrisporobacter sp.]|uniref:dethiobiotin synthase n=1 Tax=Terrisporobacter sp. TaxID=1965305 RepID=UPI002FCA5D7C
MNKGIFITGTGTDVGKTYVSALIVKLLRSQNINAGYFKAALSGAEKIDNNLIPGDAKLVCHMGGLSCPPESLVPYIYEVPVSPHLASKIENNPIEMCVIEEAFNNISENYDFIVAEGSGGIICPLRYDEKVIMLTDVMKMMKFPVIIVANAGLGTINSTILTVEYAKFQGFEIKGIVLNEYDMEDIMHNDNKMMIESLTNIPVIAVAEREGNEIILLKSIEYII